MKIRKFDLKEKYVSGGAIKYLLSPITRLLRAEARNSFQRFTPNLIPFQIITSKYKFDVEIEKNYLTQFGGTNPCDVII